MESYFFFEGMGKSAQNDVIRSEKKSEKRNNYCGRDDRATIEQVLDPRTRLILFKLLANGFLTEIDGRGSNNHCTKN